MRLLIVVVLLVSSAAIVGVAGGATTAKPRHSVEVKIPLPAPGKQRVEELTLKVKITTGKRVLNVRNLNDARLPSGIRAVVAAVLPKTSHSRIVMEKLYVLMNNLAPPSSRRLQSDDDYLDMGIAFKGAVYEGIEQAEIDGDCGPLNSIGLAADAGPGDAEGNFAYFGLMALRGHTVQPSDPEAVLDYVVYDECADEGAEQPDGDGPQ